MIERHHLGFLAFSPWKVTESTECDEDRPYGVVDDDDNLDGCFPDEAEAQARVEELNGEAEGDGDATISEIPFRAVIAVEGFETGDGRLLEVGGWNAQSPRMLPLPLWIQTDQPEYGGHAGAFVGGRIETIDRMPDGRRLYAEGFVSTADERGTWTEEQIRARNLRFVSIDVGEADVDYEIRAVDEDGWPIDVLARFTSYELMGATVVGKPAIAWAVIWLDGMEEPAEFTAALPEAPERVDAPEVVESDGVGVPLLASARDENGHPPAAWFDDPELTELTHVTITPEGRVYGHVAGWGQCHIGMPGCVTAPTSESGYAHFASGETLAHCDCDEANDQHLIRVPTGNITIGTDHAGRGLSAEAAAWHYDNTGSRGASVAVGEDEHGIWIAGAVVAGLEPAQVVELRAADVSGDWRRIAGNLEMIAVLACNVAGFSIPRRPQAHLVASGGEIIQTALLAPMGTPTRRTRQDPRFSALLDRLRAVERTLARHETVVAPLTPLAAESLAASIRGGSTIPE